MRSRSIAPFAAALLLFVGGAAVFCYPAVSSMLAERNQARVVQTYEQTVQAESEADLAAQWALAEEYNENLAGDPVHDPFVPGSGYALPDNYLEVLNLDGVMGRLTIPKIDLDLPIYHGTDEATLQKGVGHIESTSLPIGGEYRHAVLTGHRGLPSAELFTRLDELDIGDEFYIHVLDKTLAYQVDRILTVEPDELESLVAEPGRDYVTLVTCTPYGVNTHRLLVRGSRVPYTPGQEQAAAPSAALPGGRTTARYFALGVAAGLLALLAALLLVWGVRRIRALRRAEGPAAPAARPTKAAGSAKAARLARNAGPRRSAGDPAGRSPADPAGRSPADPAGRFASPAGSADTAGSSAGPDRPAGRSAAAPARPERKRHE